MRPIYLLILLALVACDGSHQKQKITKITKADVIAEKGEPLKSEKIPVKDGEVFHYPKNENFQFSGEELIAKFRDPREEEKVILYWRHKFKDCETIERKLSAPEKSHTESEMELVCESAGLSVVFSETSGFVSRVIEHEK